MERQIAGEDDKTVYHRIKQLLVSYAFFPGDRLHVPELADQLRVSATPVREALNRFCAEGLLTAVPHRGFFVRKLDQKEISELYAMKHMLLTHAARDAMPMLDLEQVERRLLRRLAGLGQEEQERPASVELYERHTPSMILLVGSLSGNVTLLSSLANVLDRLHFVRQTEVRMEDRTALVLQEAAAMAQALLSAHAAGLQAGLDAQLRREQSMLASLMKECVNRLYLRGQAAALCEGGEKRARMSMMAVREHLNRGSGVALGAE